MLKICQLQLTSSQIGKMRGFLGVTAHWLESGEGGLVLKFALLACNTVNSAVPIQGKKFVRNLSKYVRSTK